MKIYRDVIESLKNWKESDNRKPLLLKGARQTGKTWIMREFGKSFFEHVAEFSFDKSPEMADIFEKSRDTKRIINELSLFTEVPIIPGKTLIIFDEIQECNSAFNSLKYFSEDSPEYAIIAAGSLLGISIRKKNLAVPVGKVQVMPMWPVSFREFLRYSDPKIFGYIENLTHIEPLPEFVFHKINEEHRRFQICGGMPEAVVSLLSNKGIAQLEDVLQNILNLYTLDFAKYAGSSEVARINSIWTSLPSQLAKENRKFIYKVIKTGARAREYEDSLLWLEEAGFVYRIFNITKPSLPLSAYKDLSAFKLFAIDCGILRRLAKLSPEIILSGNIGYTEFKGALTENAILQSLIPQFDEKPYYWGSENKAEIDFLIQTATEIIPVEVKSDARVSGKSLSVYNAKYSPRIRIRFSSNNLKADDGMINIPHSLSCWTNYLLSLSRSPKNTEYKPAQP